MSISINLMGATWSPFFVRVAVTFKSQFRKFGLTDLFLLRVLGGRILCSSHSKTQNFFIENIETQMSKQIKIMSMGMSN